MILFAIISILICFSLIFIYRLICGRNLRLHPTERNFRQVESKDFTFFDVKYIYGVKLSEVFREMQKSPMIKNKTLDELYDITIKNRNPFEYRVIKNLRVLCHKRLREKAKYQQNKNK